MINHFRLFCVMVLVLVLLFSLITVVDSKKSLFKKRGFQAKAPEEKEQKFFKGKSKAEAGSKPTEQTDLDADIKLGGDGEEDEVKFSSEEDKNAKIARLAELRAKEGKDPTLTEKDIGNMKREERELRKNVMRAALNHGDMSREKTTALHALGRNLFKQQRYDLIYDLAFDILAIHEEMDGVDHLDTAKALTNVGSVAWKLKRGEVSRVATLRMLDIYENHEFEDRESYEKHVMLAKARLMSYQHPQGETIGGISYAEYKQRIQKEEDEYAEELKKKEPSFEL